MFEKVHRRQLLVSTPSGADPPLMQSPCFETCDPLVLQCYSLAVVGYRVATFNNCPEAAEELKQVRTNPEKKQLSLVPLNPK